MQLNEHQEKWLQELESGKHAQCKRRLYNGQGYCCLGIYQRFVRCISPSVIESEEGPAFSFEGDECGLTRVAMKKLGLNESLGLIREGSREDFFKIMLSLGYDGVSQSTNISGYNDSGATFAQIAAAIRKYPEAVFVTPEPKTA